MNWLVLSTPESKFAQTWFCRGAVNFLWSYSRQSQSKASDFSWSSKARTCINRRDSQMLSKGGFEGRVCLDKRTKAMEGS